MKSPAAWLYSVVILVLAALVVGAKSPSPSPAQKSAGPPAALFAVPPPVPTPTPHPVLSSTEKNVAMIQATAATQGSPPKPVLYLAGTEPYSTGGKNYIRLRYDVLNKSEYPAEMFAAAPSLPPCGNNTNASRTWVDFFDAAGHRIYGFCALSKPEDLAKIWVAYEEGTIPPSYVYIELNDRQTNTKYKSNLADTVL